MEDKEKYSILGARPSKETLAAEKRAQKDKKKQARQSQRQRKPPKMTKGMYGLIAGLVAVALALSGILIWVGVGGTGDGKARAADSPLFNRPDDQPEMSEEGIKAVIRQAYFTKDNHLAVVLLLSNGLDTRHRLTYLNVRIKNENGEIVAAGATDKIPETFYIEPMSTAPFTFYISPEYIELPEDDLDQLMYEIDTRGEVDDPSVLPNSASS